MPSQRFGKIIRTLPAFLLASTLHAQSPFTNVLVDASASDAECTIVINPKFPDYLIGATNSDVIYRSTDGGLSWTEDHLSNFSSAQIAGDIVLAADTAGHFFYQAMDMNSLFRTLRSDDLGLSWGTETVFGEANCFEDKSWLAIDRIPGSPYNGRIYSTWTLRYASGCTNAGYLFVQHSADAGQTWSQRDTLDVDPSFVPPIGGGIAVGPSGEVNVTWCGGLPNEIHFKKSTDGGVTWPASPVIVDNNVQPNNEFSFLIDHSMGLASLMTSLACDVSGGAYNGNLYCTWSDTRNGTNNPDIFLARSGDGGQTWSTQRINDDLTTRSQILPTVVVDPSSGWVYVSYLDARLNTDNFDDTLHYYLAWSSDGGQTFQNVQVSQQASTLGWLHSDYMGMDAYQGKIHLLWVGGTSSQKAWTACVTQAQLVSVESEPADHSALIVYPAYPNPSITFTTFDFQLAQPADVSFSVTDLQGRSLVNVQQQHYAPGRHQLRLDHHALGLAPGIYAATLSSPLGTFSRKFEVSK